MAIHYRTQSFILKKIDFGEADRFFTIFTRDFGKLETLGRAIRKIKSKLRSGVQLFYLSEIEFIQGRTYKTLTDALLIENFKGIRKDLGRLKIAFQIAELFDKVVRGQEKDEKIWNLLQETFKSLNNYSLPTTHCSLIFYYFFWNLFSVLGYSPQLYNCSLCEEKLKPDTLYFSQKDGGVICQTCFKKISPEPRKQIQKIEPDVIKIIRVILRKDLKIFLRLKIEPSYQKSLKNISENYLNYTFGKKKTEA